MGLNENDSTSETVGRRLGRLPMKTTRKALLFSDFFKFVKLPTKQEYWVKKAPLPLRSFGNLQYGCCTRAKQAVAAMRMERLEQKRTIEITDEEVIRVYQEMSDRLYGGGDNGAYEDDALCYSDDTEVLTRAGWKNFADVSVGADGDEFATRNPASKAFEWQRATAFHESAFVGDMVHLHSKSVDLLVTPNHNVLVQARPRQVRFHGKAKAHGGEWLVQAGDLLKSCQGSQRPDRRLTRQLIPATSTWHCTAVAKWEAPLREIVPGTPGAPPKQFAISGDDWARFMGMWLAEGSVIRAGGTHQHEVWVAQERQSKGFEPYRLLLKRILGREPYYIGHQFSFSSRLLADYLRGFGKCHEKYVPDAIKDMPPEQLRLFWDHYVLGDGHIRPNGRTHIVTTSRKMADDLQEIAQKLGWSAMIKQAPAAPARFTTNGVTRLVAAEACRPCYTVYVRHTAFQSFVASPEVYTGSVRCVTVPNSVLYVRRNGRPSWCGNSEWRNPEKTFRDTGGHPYTIDAYLRINAANHDEMRAALALAGAKGIAICLNMPQAFSRLDPPAVWDVPKGQPLIGDLLPGSWGGHSLWVNGYNAHGLIQDHTWELPNNVVTWDAAAAYCDEAHLCLDSLDAWRKKATTRKVKSALGDVADAVNAISAIPIVL